MNPLFRKKKEERIKANENFGLRLLKHGWALDVIELELLKVSLSR
jgi:hypothetical protein